MLTNCTFPRSTDSLFPAPPCWRTPSVSSSFTDSFTCFCSVCSALCAHSDRIALFWIFPPDCPNKPEQTGRRQRGDVTHSSEPWRLSAWRRSGGLHGDVKQESLALRTASIHLRGARSPENKPAPELFVVHLSPLKSSGMRLPPSAPAEPPLSAGSTAGGDRGGGTLGVMVFPHFRTK